MALTQQSDGTGNYIPLPKGVNKTAQATNFVKEGQSNTNWKQPIQTAADYNKGMVKGGYAQPQPVALRPTQNIYSQPVTESQRTQGIGGYDAGKQGAGNTIPLPGNRPAPQTSLATPMGTGMNLSPEDYDNLDFPSWIQNFMDKYGFRQEIDSRFPAGVDEESAFNYLYEKYGFMFPEMTDWLPDDGSGGGGSGDYSYSGGGSYIPMPSYDTWGGGGYGNDNGYRDSGLVNWRI